MDDRLRYLRVSLLDHCNLACSYCRPPGSEGDPGSRVDPGVVIRAIGLLHKLGVKKVRFTGGEPTLHRALPDLIEATKQLDPNIVCAMTSNGVLLSKLAETLGRVGLDSVNISLDTLIPDKFLRLTGRDNHRAVLKGIESSIAALPEVKINCVIMKGVNDDEAPALVKFANELGVDLRFIEFMPTRHSPRHRDLYLSGDSVRAVLPYDFEAVESYRGSAAGYYRAGNLKIRVGFINPVSHSFCGDCDRIRLASDGRLFGCLFSGQSINLFDLLDSEEEFSASVREVLASKQYVGCSSGGGQTGDLPSFVSIGG